MIEGLWSVVFISEIDVMQAGVVILETEQILGGDSHYFYLGTYKFQNNELHAEIEVTHYYGKPISIFGPEKKTLVSKSLAKLRGTSCWVKCIVLTIPKGSWTFVSPN